MVTSGIHQITLRLPDSLYESIKRVARRRRTSINRLAQEGLERLAQEESAAQMRAAYELLGADQDNDVEFFIAAQSEVVLREPA